VERVVALLRGVNVGGRKLSMAALRDGLTRAGCTDVETYIQSGNVVLTSPPSAGSDTDAWLSSVISRVAGFEVAVVTRTADELDAVIAENPYPDAGGTQLHVVFHCDAPDPTVLAQVPMERFAPEACTLVGRDLYLYVPNGLGRALLPAAIDKAARKVKVAPGTARNWNTVLKLQAMSRA
jgi:uncharacterized protein (DUF1697 family)